MSVMCMYMNENYDTICEQGAGYAKHTTDNFSARACPLERHLLDGCLGVVAGRLEC